MSEKIIDRIKKLLNMSVKNGATEEEAKTAMQMAANLAARHDLDLAEIAEKTGSAQVKEAVKEFREHEPLKTHEINLLSAAARLFNVRFLLYASGTRGYVFIGTPTDCELAGHTYLWLEEQLTSIYKAHLAMRPGMTKKERGIYRDGFKQGCSARIKERAIELMNAMETDDRIAHSSTGRTALVVANHFEQKRQDIAAYMKDQGYNVGQARTRKMTGGDGFAHGYAAGSRVQLRKEVQ